MVCKLVLNQSLQAMARQKRSFILPELKNTRNKGEKIWYIEFSYRCVKTDKMIRQRISKPFTNIDSKKDLLKIANPLIKNLSNKLISGWNPSDDNKNTYIDFVDYHQTAKMYGRKKKSNRTVRAAASKFIESKTNCKKSTIQNYSVKLRNLTIWCETNGFKDLDIISINNQVIQNYFRYLREEKKLDASTIKYYKTMLWSFFNWSTIELKLKENPVFNIIMQKKTTDYSARPFLQHDINRLLDLIQKGDKQLYLACLFQYFLAIRPGTELRLLKIKDIDFYNNAVTVEMSNAKNGKRQTIDLPKQLTKICTQDYNLHTYNSNYYVFSNIGMPGEKPLSKNNMRERFNRFRDALRLPKYYKYYSFKHTGAGKFLNSGATIEELRNHLRHSSIETTHKYAKNHFGERNLKAINKFPDPRS